MLVWYREEDCITCCDLAEEQFSIAEGGLSEADQTERFEACRNEGCSAIHIEEDICTELFPVEATKADALTSTLSSGDMHNHRSAESQRFGCELGRGLRFAGVSNLFNTFNPLLLRQCTTKADLGFNNTDGQAGEELDQLFLNPVNNPSAAIENPALSSEDCLSCCDQTSLILRTIEDRSENDPALEGITVNDVFDVSICQVSTFFVPLSHIAAHSCFVFLFELVV